jgi:hypothetical protein
MTDQMDIIAHKYLPAAIKLANDLKLKGRNQIVERDFFSEDNAAVENLPIGTGRQHNGTKKQRLSAFSDQQLDHIIS